LDDFFIGVRADPWFDRGRGTMMSDLAWYLGAVSAHRPRPRHHSAADAFADASFERLKHGLRRDDADRAALPESGRTRQLSDSVASGLCAAHRKDTVMDEASARAMIAAHFEWACKDEVRASQIYADDAVLEFPQSGERIRGKAGIIEFRSAYPARVTLELHRTIGRDDLWVNECTVRYDGARPHKGVGIMEFRHGKVFRERIYVGEPWDPPAWRAQWVERMDEATI
jgi:hypothetical protein